VPPGKILGVEISHDIGASGDDCLNLNILTPHSSTPMPPTSLPVMVWIHGGSNVMCSNKGDFGGFSNTASSTFVSRGVVCVSINYRVALHGFLHLPDHNITNLALRDIILSLTWVRDNISSFNGDPNNVTVVGESAGGIAISNLLGCPKAKGLFRRAVVQSGGISMWPRKLYEGPVMDDIKDAVRPFMVANGFAEAADEWR